MFNSDRKNRYLNNEYPNDSTREMYSLLLDKISVYEKDKNKDVCDFSYNEAKELLIGLRRRSEGSLDVVFTVISTYIDWCIKEGYSQTGFNAFKLLTKEDRKKCVHQQSFLTRDEMYEICDSLFNYVDKALIVALFEGIRGRPEYENSYEEIRNLKSTDLFPDINQVIVRRNNGTLRPITIDKRTMDILIGATNEVEYFKENGSATGRFAKMALKDTGYIIRTIDMGEFNNGEDDRIATSSIGNKFRNYRRYLDINYLTPTMIFYSGLIEKCQELEELVGELKPEHFQDILEKQKLNKTIYYTLKQKYELFKESKKSITSK